MMTVQLHDVKFSALHGIDKGEETLGNQFVVDLDITYDEGKNDTSQMSNTINYVDLFEILKSRMMVPTSLLEKLCDGTIRHLRHQYPFIKEVTLTIHKLQAPIINFQGTVGVSMNKKFND